MKIKHVFLCALFLNLSIWAKAYSQEGSSLKSVAQLLVQTHRIAGVSVARIENNKIIELFSINNTELMGSGVNDNSVFQVGSISKPVAAWAVMTLVRDGKIKLDDPVGNHLSRWQLPDSEYQQSAATIRRLLSHTAGLRLGGYPGFKETEELPSIEESLSGSTNHAGAVSLFQKPGAGFSYSGGGYTLLQLLIEEVSGMPFHQYAEQAVLAPLGMSNSSYLPSEPVRSKRSQAYRVVNEPIDQFQFRARAAAGLHSTAEDLAKFVIANISDNPVLSRELIDQMHSPVADAGFANVGLGFFIFKQSELVGHGGSNFGWRADIAFDKSGGSGLVVLTNSERGERLIPSLKCAWQVNYMAGRNHKSCSKNLDQQNRSQQQFEKIGTTLIAIALLIIAFSLWLGITKKPAWRFSNETTGRALLVVIILILGGIAAFMHTPVGVYLIGGFRSIFSTLHYAPMGSERLLSGVYSILLSLACLVLAIPKR